MTKNSASSKPKVIRLDRPMAGSHINSVCDEAIKLAKRKRVKVSFEFNQITVIVSAKDTVESAVKRWDRKREAEAKRYRESDEYKQAEARRVAEEKRKNTAIYKAKGVTEQDLRALRKDIACCGVFKRFNEKTRVDYVLPSLPVHQPWIQIWKS
jgi:hypothetical protein